jgi:hypothetical protein
MSQPDSLIGVRGCGCITAWMSTEHADTRDVIAFYASMADSNRQVREANLNEIKHRVGRCEHRGAEPALGERTPHGESS